MHVPAAINCDISPGYKRCLVTRQIRRQPGHFFGLPKSTYGHCEMIYRIEA
jgi:hypothetical protein